MVHYMAVSSIKTVILLSYSQLLEQGLRKHPASQADRWDQIAELVGTRTKVECVTRFKVSPC